MIYSNQKISTSYICIYIIPLSSFLTLIHTHFLIYIYNLYISTLTIFLLEVFYSELKSLLFLVNIIQLKQMLLGII